MYVGAGPLRALYGIFVFHLVNYKPLTYNKVYVYPWWAEMIRWLLALSSMLCITGCIVYNLIMAKGSFRELWESLTKPMRAVHHLESMASNTDINLSSLSLGISDCNVEETAL